MVASMVRNDSWLSLVLSDKAGYPSERVPIMRPHTTTVVINNSGETYKSVLAVLADSS